jgi:hypothetical protein
MLKAVCITDDQHIKQIKEIQTAWIWKDTQRAYLNWYNWKYQMNQWTATAYKRCKP